MNRSDRFARILISFLLAVILALSLCVPALADEGDLQFTTISGKVTDDSGAPLSGVRVQLFDIDDNIAQKAVFSDSSGDWTTVGLDIIAGHSYLVNYYKRGWAFSDNNLSCMAEVAGTVVPNIQAVLVASDVAALSDFTFTFDSVRMEAKITKYTGTAEVLVVPTQVDNYTVTSIADNAFVGKDLIRTIWLPESLTSIGKSVFSNTFYIIRKHYFS